MKYLDETIIKKLLSDTLPSFQAVSPHDLNIGFGFLFYGFTRAIRPKNICVIGSKAGFSTITFALGLKDNTGSRIEKVECWDTKLLEPNVQGRVFFVDPSYSSERDDKNHWYGIGFWDDKEKTKTRLRKGNFPVADGKAFWFLQKKKALTYGMEKLGIPLTVKPRGGSFSRHVTCNINSSRELENAIDKAIKYSPSFIIERFLKDISVFRATVVDFDFIACCERIPANVVGDGEHSIKQLIKIKNTHAFRKNFKGKDTPLCKIIADKTTDELLKNKDYNLTTIPFKKEIVWLQKDPFWRLGADVIESTEKAHPDNLKLFKDVAKAFDTRLVGIDFLVKNISVSWKNQVSAIIELNSLPCIELHHFPSLGPPQNAAKAVADLFFKYYL